MTDLSAQNSVAAGSKETSAVAVAQASKSLIEARFTVALARPRDVDRFRAAILKDCQRPGFADKALYDKPVGNGQSIEGMSIRFAESALRHFGNLLCEAITVFDDDEKSIIRVMVTDLETNSCDTKDVTVRKTVERKTLRKGRVSLGTRTNSYGDLVYIVHATDDECLNKTNSAIAKVKRNLILALIPFDITEECMQRCKETSRDRDAKDPETANRRVIDAFSTLGVSPTDLISYMGKPPARFQPADLVELRGLYESICGGEATWEEAMEKKHPPQTSGNAKDAFKEPKAKPKKEEEVDYSKVPDLGDNLPPVLRRSISELAEMQKLTDKQFADKMTDRFGYSILSPEHIMEVDLSDAVRFMKDLGKEKAEGKAKAKG